MLRFSALENLGVAVAAMSEMRDGDCGFKGPDPTCAARNLQSVCDSYAVDPRHLVCAQQVHGSNVAWATDADRGRNPGGPLDPFPETDALLTGVPRLPLAIFAADCVPVFLYDARNRIAGLVHAGREGTLARIAARAVAFMRDERGTRPGDVHAVIGPSAGPCCYEVAPGMAASFAAAGLPVNGRNLDLWKANALQLTTSGVPESHIATIGVCTVCTTTFFSHRREPDGARNMALLVI